MFSSFSIFVCLITLAWDLFSATGAGKRCRVEVVKLGMAEKEPDDD